MYTAPPRWGELPQRHGTPVFAPALPVEGYVAAAPEVFPHHQLNAAAHDPGPVPIGILVDGQKAGNVKVFRDDHFLAGSVFHHPGSRRVPDAVKHLKLKLLPVVHVEHLGHPVLPGKNVRDIPHPGIVLDVFEREGRGPLSSALVTPTISRSRSISSFMLISSPSSFSHSMVLLTLVTSFFDIIYLLGYKNLVVSGLYLSTFVVSSWVISSVPHLRNRCAFDRELIEYLSHRLVDDVVNHPWHVVKGGHGR